MNNNSIHIETHKNQLHEWFDVLLHSIQTDKLLLSEGMASKEKVKFYDTLFFGNENQINAQSRLSSTMHFLKQVLFKYLTVILNERKIKFQKLALDIADSKILVWVEIHDDDEEAENNLILAEAQINAEFSEFGFNINTTIVEESDKLDIPSHYQIFNKGALNNI